MPVLLEPYDGDLGPTGVDKTNTGRLLAERLGWEFAGSRRIRYLKRVPDC